MGIIDRSMIITRGMIALHREPSHRNIFGFEVVVRPSRVYRLSYRLTSNDTEISPSLSTESSGGGDGGGGRGSPDAAAGGAGGAFVAVVAAAKTLDA